MSTINNYQNNYFNENRKLGKKDIKTLALSSLGSALEFYDFIIYVFYASIISHLFFPSSNELLSNFNTYAAFAAGYFARPLGGIIMAHFGDKFGRKKTFNFSITLMALSILGIASLPSFATIGYAAPILLILLRVLQGIAIGGEMPNAWVYIGENSPKKVYGLVLGLLTSSFLIGILMGSLISFTMSKIFTHNELLSGYWRIPFFIGAIFGIVSIGLRKKLHETPIFEKISQNSQQSKKLPLLKVFTEYKARFILSVILTWTLTGSVLLFVLMSSNFLKAYISPASDVFIAQSFAIAACTIGCIFFGFLSDKIGKGFTLMIASIGLFVCSYLFFGGIAQKQSLSQLVPSYIIGCFFVGYISLIPIVVLKSFKAEVRLTGLSSSYNLSYAVFGGLTPMFVVYLSSVTPFGIMYYMLFISGLIFVIGTLLATSRKKITPYVVYAE